MKKITALAVSTLIVAMLIVCCRSEVERFTGNKPLIAKDTFYENEKNNTLFVFVGRKLSLTDMNLTFPSMDAGFKARYEILQRVYGNYDKDVIEFEAYDHYGIPEFSRFETVLLYVSEEDGKYYHEKYQFDPVFETNDGRWAGPYSEGYDHSFNKNTKVKPVKILFKEEVYLPTKITPYPGETIELSYPEPYYKTIGEKAFIIYGNYVEELFKLKKDGVLTARDLFGPKQPEPGIKEVILEEIPFVDSLRK